MEMCIRDRFAGGKLSDDALDGAMRALNEAYWIAKDKNKKYGRKKKKRHCAAKWE